MNSSHFAGGVGALISVDKLAAILHYQFGLPVAPVDIASDYASGLVFLLALLVAFWYNRPLKMRKEDPNAPNGTNSNTSGRPFG